MSGPRRLVVPVDLGGAEHVCALSPPRRPPPEPELVRALVDHYDSERRRSASDRLEVGFFRGGVPGEALLAATGGHPLRLACTPADLLPDALPLLLDLGVETVELEILTLDGGVLRACRRGYGPRLLRGMIPALRRAGLRLGLHLAPGLPGSSHAQALADAEAILREPELRPDFVRILPAVALEGSQLARWAAEGRWTPMTLGEAVTTCVALVDLLQSEGIEVARVGFQAGPDANEAVAAGPAHPDLRGLVEVRRYRRRLEQALQDQPSGAHVIVAVNPRDLSWLKGTANENLRAVRARLRLAAIRIATDEAVPRGEVHLVEYRAS